MIFSTQPSTDHIYFEKHGVFFLLSVCSICLHPKRNKTVGAVEKNKALNDFISRYYRIRWCLFSLCVGINDCDYEIFGVSMKKIFVLFAILFFGLGMLPVRQ